MRSTELMYQSQFTQTTFSENRIKAHSFLRNCITNCATHKFIITGKKKYIVTATLQLRFYTHIRSVIKLNPNTFTGDAPTSNAESVPAISAATDY